MPGSSRGSVVACAAFTGWAAIFAIPTMIAGIYPTVMTVTVCLCGLL